MPDNETIIERFDHAFTGNDTATIDELCDPQLVDHNPAPGAPPTLEGFKATIAGYKAAFPDLEFAELGDIVWDGDTVATRWTVNGTHEGEMMGIAPSGKRISVEGMNFYQLKEGRITDVWTQFDGVGMLQQLGVMPVPEAACG